LSFDTRLAQDSIAEPTGIFRTSTNPAAFSLRITSAQVTLKP
jgi:hypothetical protein